MNAKDAHLANSDFPGPVKLLSPEMRKLYSLSNPLVLLIES